jgi:hypothetical protein
MNNSRISKKLVTAAIAGLVLGTTLPLASCGDATAGAHKEKNGCNGPNGCGTKKGEANGCNGHNGCKAEAQKK